MVWSNLAPSFKHILLYWSGDGEGNYSGIQEEVLRPVQESMGRRVLIWLDVLTRQTRACRTADAKQLWKTAPPIVVHNPRQSESDRQGLVHDKISMAPEMSRVTDLLIMLVGAATQLARIRSPRAQESPRARARKRNPRGPSKTEVGRRGSADGSVERRVRDAPRSRRPKP